MIPKRACGLAAILHLSLPVGCRLCGGPSAPGGCRPNGLDGLFSSWHTKLTCTQGQILDFSFLGALESIPREYRR